MIEEFKTCEELVSDGDELALVLSDHRLPGRSGVDFLVELVSDPALVDEDRPRHRAQADQDDTIRPSTRRGPDHHSNKLPTSPSNRKTASTISVSAPASTKVADRSI